MIISFSLVPTQRERTLDSQKKNIPIKFSKNMDIDQSLVIDGDIK